MAQATFRHGNPVTIDYMPSLGDVAAGDVIVLVSIPANTTGQGLTTGVAHKDIANNVLGDVSAGGGVYDVINLDNAADYAEVWWDDANDKITTTSTNNAKFGYIVEGGAGGANSTCKALHHPYV